MEYINDIALPLPWGAIPHDPPVEITHKVHLIAWYTSGFI